MSDVTSNFARAQAFFAGYGLKPDPPRVSGVGDPPTISPTPPADGGSPMGETDEAIGMLNRRRATPVLAAGQSGNGPGFGLLDETEEEDAVYDELEDHFRFGTIPQTGLAAGTSIDIVVHELAHRITRYQRPDLANNVTSGITAGILESLCDTFAFAVDTDDWTIGEDVIPGGIRRADKPTTLADVREGAFHLVSDTNAQIANRIAYKIGSRIGRQGMADIYMHALRYELRPDRLDFDGLRAATHAAAVCLYGANSREVRAVEAAWSEMSAGPRPR